MRIVLYVIRRGVRVNLTFKIMVDTEIMVYNSIQTYVVADGLGQGYYFDEDSATCQQRQFSHVFAGVLCYHKLHLVIYQCGK